MPVDNVIPFPRRFRVVQRRSAYGPPPDLVEHAGQTYRWAELFAQLTPYEREQIDATSPRTAQAAWDEVTRRWPTLAAEMVAEIGAAD